MREYQVRICERLGVKFPGPTRQNLTHAPRQAMCTGCQFAAVEAAATASRSWAFELQNRSAIEPLSPCANGRKETGGCKASKGDEQRLKPRASCLLM